MTAPATTLDPPRSALFEPFLAADIGGTHARVALVRPSRSGSSSLEVIAYQELTCRDFKDLPELLRAFIEGSAVGTRPRRCALAVAGQVLGGSVLNDNLAWPIRLAEVRRALAFDDVAAVNDFAALGYVLDAEIVGAGRLLWGADANPGDGARLIVGPGTGLGTAVRLPGTHGEVLASEAGQMDFSAVTPREHAIIARLAPVGGYVAYEQIVSGPGLLTLYQTLCALDGVSARVATPEAVTAAALAQTDAKATEAVEIFCAALGSFVGDVTLAHMAVGGVYLAGGFLPSIFELLERSDFVVRFLHGRSARTLLARVPIRVVKHGRYGVLGAAKWYLARLSPAKAKRRRVKHVRAAYGYGA